MVDPYCCAVKIKNNLHSRVAKVINLASGYNQGFSPLLCSLGGSDQGSIGCHPGTLEHFFYFGPIVMGIFDIGKGVNKAQNNKF